MNNTTSKLVTPTRFRQILDCYGSTPSAWPQDERQAALSLLKASPELQTLHDQAQTLDKLLIQQQKQESYTIDDSAMQALQQRIMRELPEQEVTDNRIDINRQSGRRDHSKPSSTHRSHRSHLWMGSLAASLFIVSLSVGVIHQLLGPGHTIVPPTDRQHVTNQQNNVTAYSDFDKWAWEDITGESLPNNTDNGPANMLALVDMELPPE
jgi:hypothetical protein